MATVTSARLTVLDLRSVAAYDRPSGGRASLPSRPARRFQCLSSWPRRFTLAITLLNELKELASAFRAALESADRSRLPVTLQAFPHGACGDTALLLAKFLEEHGHGQFDYMLGRRGDGSHAWLQRGSPPSLGQLLRAPGHH